MRQKKTILLINIFCLVLLFLITGCDNSRQAPEPPHAEAALVIELLSSLKNKDYKLAEKKLKRFRGIDVDDIYLENIQIRIRNNLLIAKAQQLLNSGDINGSIKSLNQKISVEGQNSALVGALNQLGMLKNIKLLTDNILNAKKSRDLAIGSGKLSKALASYPAAKTLLNFSNSKLNHARNLLVIEKRLAIEDLKADIDIAWVLGTPYLDTMIASLELEDPKNPEVLAYKKAMQENWTDEKLSELYYNPEKEFIFFRKGLLLTGDTEREDIYSALLYLSPSNYRSLLIKALLLKFAGYQKESSGITSQIAEALSASSSKARQWFRLVPNGLIGINKVNPFVLYPFFIYYDDKLF
jgi:hypothetical protein